MAYLQTLNWTLEVRYFPHPHVARGIRYEIFFRYKDDPIVRDDLLKRSPKIWHDRTPGALLAHETEGCSLVPVLGETLKSGRAAVWRPSDPDFTVAVYPGRIFPFLEDTPLEEESHLDSDDLPFSVVAMVDAYNFGNEFAYHGFGPALIMVVKRSALQEFYDDLRAELEVFIEEYGPIGDAPEIREDL